MYYVLHGEDDFSSAEEVNKLRARMGDPQFADLNTTRLNGRTTTMGELRHHADAIPFLADKRLVIVEGLLARFNPRPNKPDETNGRGETGEEPADPEFAAQLAGYLPNLPPTTRLVFVEPRKLAKNNPILKFAEKDKENARVKLFSPPGAENLPHWIEERVQARGGRIEFSAANRLAMAMGTDLRAVDNEIEKLVTYCQGETIRFQDVGALVSSVQEESIFKLVDALGQRRTGEALELLHAQLRQNVQLPQLYGMIIRQYRLLLQVRDLAARGMKADEIHARLKLNPWVAKKMMEQSRNFTIEQLEWVYHKLLETDIAIKTSRGDPVVNLDVLVVELTKGRP